MLSLADDEDLDPDEHFMFATVTDELPVTAADQTRPVKALLFGELEGFRKVGRPLIRYKDTCKMALQQR